MATLSELQGAYESLRQIFASDLKPRINALSREVDGGATYTQTATEINSLRAELNNAYSRINEFLLQAQQIQPRPDDFIAQLERSLNTNQANNRSALAQIEIKARANQSVPVTAQDDAATDSTGQTVDQAQAARADGASTQIPEVTADDTATRSSNAVEFGDTADANFQLENGDTADNNLSLTTTGNVNAGNNNQVNDDTGTAVSNAVAASSTNPTTGVANLQSPRLLYKATVVTSKFSKGRFTQDLEGVLLGLTPENGSLNGTVRF